MKVLKRNKKVIWYANPTGEMEDILDSYGNYTGEQRVVFATPVEYDRFSFGPMQSYAAALSRGFIKQEPYGLVEDYTLPLVTDDMDCPIQPDSRAWVDVEPWDSQGNLVPNTHLVTAVLPSINVVKVTLKKVSIS